MGMCDTLFVDRSIDLPFFDPYTETNTILSKTSWNVAAEYPDFQTKDLMCHNETYKIDANGKLWRRSWYKPDKWPRLDIGWMPESYSGTLGFYTTIDHLWVSYKSVLFMGQLMELHYTGYDLFEEKNKR